MATKLVATFLIAIIALLAYQAEPITGTIGWVVVSILTLSLIVSTVRGGKV